MSIGRSKFSPLHISLLSLRLDISDVGCSAAKQICCCRGGKALRECGEQRSAMMAVFRKGVHEFRCILRHLLLGRDGGSLWRSTRNPMVTVVAHGAMLFLSRLPLLTIAAHKLSSARQGHPHTATKVSTRERGQHSTHALLVGASGTQQLTLSER